MLSSGGVRGILELNQAEEGVARLETIGCDAYKIASGDLTYHALIERAAATGKPLLLSTGMSDIQEIREAVLRARDAGGCSLAVLRLASPTLCRISIRR